ncbi:MAG: hypothetical protein AB7O59_24925 [Pirellulales bacterium]
MAPDLLEQLADVSVPPPPAEFDTQLHEKVNRGLVLSQLVELFLYAMPWACAHFGKAVLGVVAFTVTGRYESKSKRRRR